MKYLLLLAVVFLAGCDNPNITGMPSLGPGFNQQCVNGVVYIVRGQGISVKFNRNGTVATCGEVE